MLRRRGHYDIDVLSTVLTLGTVGTLMYMQMLHLQLPSPNQLIQGIKRTEYKPFVYVYVLLCKGVKNVEEDNAI